jgi:pimeloyl-ACP methyl ester carboxylesterase
VGGVFLDDLLDRWANAYDWEAHRRRIDELPWVTVGSGDSELHVIHQRSQDADAPVVVLLHGWPDSVLRFERVLPLLTDVHVVVPALPGFPFAAPVTAPGMSGTRIAALLAVALKQLGYQRYTLSGGDFGGRIAEILAARHPDRVAALHLTNVATAHMATVDPTRLPADAAAHVDQVGQWRRSEGGFAVEQATRPNTLAVALGDSPAGLAAWIVEKLEAWSDEQSFTPDELLTWVTAYWTTGTIATSFAMYTETDVLPGYVGTPTVFSAFPQDVIPAPRSYAEIFLNVVEYVEHLAGGHFAAWEQPSAYTEDLRRAVKIASERMSLEGDT